MTNEQLRAELANLRIENQKLREQVADPIIVPIIPKQGAQPPAETLQSLLDSAHSAQPSNSDWDAHKGWVNIVTRQPIGGAA